MDPHHLQSRFAVRANLTSIFLFALGNYVLIPYYAVYTSKNLGYGVAFAGILVSVRMFSQRGLTLVGGVLTDYFGAKLISQVGILLRATSFLILFFDRSPSSFVISAFANGTSSSLFNMAIRKMLFFAVREDDSRLTAVISLRSALLNLGAAIGPLLGTFFLYWDFSLTCLCVTMMFVGLGTIVWVANRTFEAARISTIRPADFLRVIRLPGIQRVMLLQFIYFYFYSNLEYLLPIFSTEQGHQGLVGILFTTNAVVVAGVQFTSARRIANAGVNLGFWCFLAFFLLLGSIAYFSPGVGVSVLLVLAVALFTIAEIVISFRVEYLSTKLGDKSLGGTTYGLVSVVGAIGMLAANALNEQLYRWLGPASTWSINALLVVAAIAYLWRIRTPLLDRLPSPAKATP